MAILTLHQNLRIKIFQFTEHIQCFRNFVILTDASIILLAAHGLQYQGEPRNYFWGDLTKGEEGCEITPDEKAFRGPSLENCIN